MILAIENLVILEMKDRDIDAIMLATAIELKLKVEKLCLPSSYGLERYTVEKGNKCRKIISFYLLGYKTTHTQLDRWAYGPYYPQISIITSASKKDRMLQWRGTWLLWQNLISVN